MIIGNGAVDNMRVGKHYTPFNQDVTKIPPHRDLYTLIIQEDHRSRFYEHYRKEAEEYDKEFMKKYDEDLNTTLIFVSYVWCLGACADPIAACRLVCSRP